MSQLNLTIPESIHLRLESLAEREGVPVNTLVACALAEKVAVLDAGSYLRERAARGKMVDFDAFLAQVPDVEPEDHDRLSPDLAAWIHSLKDEQLQKDSAPQS